MKAIKKAISNVGEGTFVAVFCFGGCSLSLAIATIVTTMQNIVAML